MFYPHVPYQHPAPFSTGNHPRQCRLCGAPFVGLGTLCPVHLSAHARQRAAELQAERAHSAAIITARELQAQNARPQRAELPDELDA